MNIVDGQKNKTKNVAQKSSTQYLLYFYPRNPLQKQFLGAPRYCQQNLVICFLTCLNGFKIYFKFSVLVQISTKLQLNFSWAFINLDPNVT